MVEIVEVDLLLGKRTELTVISLLEDVRLQLLLPHFVSIDFRLVLRLCKSCLGIPTGVGRDILTFLRAIESR